MNRSRQNVGCGVPEVCVWGMEEEAYCSKGVLFKGSTVGSIDTKEGLNVGRGQGGGMGEH